MRLVFSDLSRGNSLTVQIAERPCTNYILQIRYSSFFFVIKGVAIIFYLIKGVAAHKGLSTAAIQEKKNTCTRVFIHSFFFHENVGVGNRLHFLRLNNLVKTILTRSLNKMSWEVCRVMSLGFSEKSFRAPWSVWLL